MRRPAFDCFSRVVGGALALFPISSLLPILVSFARSSTQPNKMTASVKESSQLLSRDPEHRKVPWPHAPLHQLSAGLTSSPQVRTRNFIISEPLNDCRFCIGVCSRFVEISSGALKRGQSSLTIITLLRIHQRVNKTPEVSL